MVGERVKKGRPVLIEGSLNSYEQEEIGEALRKKVTRLEIRVRRVTPLDWDEKTQQLQASGTSQHDGIQRPVEEPIPEDDIPF